MSIVLILAADDAVREKLRTTVRNADFIACVPAGEQTAFESLEVWRPNAVLLEAELDVPASFVPRAWRMGMRVIFTSTTLSAYDLARKARHQGLRHLTDPTDAAQLRALASDVLDRSTLARDDRARMEDTLAAATHEMARARALIEQSRRIVLSAQELRASNQIALAACRRGGDVLRTSVIATSCEMRSGGATLAEVISLVESALSLSARNGAESLPDAAEAALWCEEGFKAA